ncbi:DUF5662 family protein [Candidatus Gracilibacteria bacterium]|nr:DUF5662 family protein [Candidatus Gracilibacteria bacterium]
MDSGSALLDLFVKWYSKDFVRQLWDGNDQDFEKAYTKIYAKLNRPPKDPDATDYDSAVDTLLHIKRINSLLLQACAELMKRAQHHDDSKLKNPEKPFFDSETPKLAGLTYGTPEYAESRKILKTALDHHYAHNSHHPEHYKEGINDFDLFDLLEMFVDWKASSERHHDGNILKSIEKNADRFGISPQLVRILNNTAKKIDKF